MGLLEGSSPVVPESFDDLPRRFQRALLGEEVSFPDPLDPERATLFQRAVWEVVRSIPYGKTQSYLWVALQVGKPGAARAVGQALGANPFFMVVPCHRVLAQDGSLGGFAGGLAMKRRLLEIEALKALHRS
ncbi:MAG: MGMT family protein [Chloroflexota bacterium]|nr:MGMT family protein [Chloroflexota bacterium]